MISACVIEIFLEYNLAWLSYGSKTGENHDFPPIFDCFHFPDSRFGTCICLILLNRGLYKLSPDCFGYNYIYCQLCETLSQQIVCRILVKIAHCEWLSARFGLASLLTGES